jgi:hypothetical protein
MTIFKVKGYSKGVEKEEVEEVPRDVKKLTSV